MGLARVARDARGPWGMIEDVMASKTTDFTASNVREPMRPIRPKPKKI